MIKQKNENRVDELVTSFIDWYEDESTFSQEFFDIRNHQKKWDECALIWVSGDYDGGKTVSFKNQSLYQFLKYGKKTLKIYNGEEMMDEDTGFSSTEKNKDTTFYDFFRLKKEWEVWSLVTLKKGKFYDYVYFNGEMFMKLKNIASNPKAGRIEDIDTLIYDEFNYFNSRLHLNYQLKNWDVLLSRFIKQGKRIVLIGNTNTISVPVLQYYNQFSLPTKTEYLKVEGNYKAVFIKVDIGIKNKEDKYKDSPVFEMIKNGFNKKHFVDNISFDAEFDEYVQYFSESDLDFISNSKTCFLMDGEIFTIYYIDKKHSSKMSVKHIARYGRNPKYCLSKSDSKPGVIHTPIFNDALAKYFLQGKISFNDHHALNNFKEILTPYFRVNF